MIRTHQSWIILPVLLVCGAAFGGPAAGADEREVWPLPVKGAEGDVQESSTEPRRIEGREVAGRPVLRLTDISRASLEVFPADPATATGTAVIVCPGGGYRILAYDLEGTEVAAWLQGIGVTALVLKYRVPKAEEEKPGERPLEDLRQALRLVRERSDELKIDPTKVGVLGFSAGGHLAVSSATVPEESAADSPQAAFERPDFLIPIYPAYLADSNSERPQLDPALQFDSRTPPTFMVVTQDDADRAVGAALLMIELKKQKVPTELHIFVRGGHGYGLRVSEDAVSQWPQLCESWMRAMGYL
ncbi:alpha/beta hydrolase [Candidatus Laterigemmans baculatus]|uniref:alpha/beta hydrolase n=1 Tax=Candidatus Laterigemmans baculatus TaxID=2770505 RepID=UPI0013DA1A4E|nr:alpha/beta hydrolase [Candidatus Laterigemmans baculatus]